MKHRVASNGVYRQQNAERGREIGLIFTPTHLSIFRVVYNSCAKGLSCTKWQDTSIHSAWYETTIWDAAQVIYQVDAGSHSWLTVFKEKYWGGSKMKWQFYLFFNLFFYFPLRLLTRPLQNSIPSMKNLTKTAHWSCSCCETTWQWVFWPFTYSIG